MSKPEDQGISMMDGNLGDAALSETAYEFLTQAEFDAAMNNDPFAEQLSQFQLLRQATPGEVRDEQIYAYLREVGAIM
jgi:hypothetical protein